MRKALLLICLLSAVPALAAETKLRLLTIGGTISEIVCALDRCADIIATDSSSRYPAELGRLPQVGYARSLSAEGVLAQNPDLIILGDEAGPPAALEQLRRSGKKILEISARPDLAAARERILHISQALGQEVQGREMLARLDADLERLNEQRKTLKQRPKVLFVYARGHRSLLIAGNETAASTLIELAGAENAVHGFKGFKTLTPEAVVAAEPEVILMVEGGVASLGGPEALWSLPGLAMTPAYAKRRLIRMDDLLLLGMGPRLGQAALELLQKWPSSESARVKGK